MNSVPIRTSKTDQTPQSTSSLDAECERLNANVYLEVFGGYRWEFRQADGHYIDCKEAYDSREDCVQAAIEAASRWMRLHCTSVDSPATSSPGVVSAAPRAPHEAQSAPAKRASLPRAQRT